MLRRKASEYGCGVRDADRVCGAVYTMAGSQCEQRVCGEGTQSLAPESESRRAHARRWWVLGRRCKHRVLGSVASFRRLHGERQTVHFPHHVHVDGQNPDTVILNDAAVPREVRLDLDVPRVGIEGILNKLGDCVAECCNNEGGAESEGH